MTDETMTARSIRENTAASRNGLIVTRVNGVPMIAAHLVEDVIDRQERAFKSLIRAIEGEGFEVHVDVDGTFTVEPRTGANDYPTDLEASLDDENEMMKALDVLAGKKEPQR